MKVDSDSVALTISYCLQHADNVAEERTIVWLAEHLADQFERDHPRGFVRSWFLSQAGSPVHMTPNHIIPEEVV